MTILVTTTQNRPSLPPFSAVQGNHFHRIDHETSVQDRPVSHEEGIQGPADSGLRWFSDRDPWGDQDSGLSQRLLPQLGLRVEGPSHSRKEGPGQLQLHRSQHLRQPMSHRLHYPEKRIERVESSHADQLKPGMATNATLLCSTVVVQCIEKYTLSLHFNVHGGFSEPVLNLIFSQILNGFECKRERYIYEANF